MNTANDDATMTTANDLLRRATRAGHLPGLMGLLAATARFAERSGITRATLHALLDAGYTVSADVGDTDADAPQHPLRAARARRVVKARNASKARQS